MFERFTEQAIKVIMLAQEEARRLGHNYVATEQILLGLIGEGTNIAAKVLRWNGVKLKDARAQVELIIGRGLGFIVIEIPFTPEAKHLHELALREASDLGVNYVGPEHLLLGMIACDDGQDHGLIVLQHFGIDLAKLKQQLIEAIATLPQDRSPKPGFAPPSGKSLNPLLKLIARDLKQQKDTATRIQQFEIAASLLEAENRLLEKIRKTEPKWAISEPDTVEETIENALTTIRTIKEIAIREQDFELAGWLWTEEIRLTEKGLRLGIDIQQIDPGARLTFSEKTAQVIMLAQHEARRVGHNFVGTEQILLGLIGQGTGIAAKALKASGVNLKDARAQVERIIGRGSGFVAAEIPFTPRTKRVIEVSSEQARQLGSKSIDTEHLLLGLIQEREGVAARVLELLCIDLGVLRKKIFQLLDRDDVATG